MQQTERESKQALMAPTSSTEEHSGELEPLAVVKRKRTKRPRHPPASSASSSESTTTEEEDMAHCLILLAQGGGAGVVDSKPEEAAAQAQAQAQQQQRQAVAVVSNQNHHHKSERYTSRKYTEAATTADGVKAGFYVYECRTCNKCFPTFQALGGHRASHKKPRFLDDDVAIAKPSPPPPMVVITPPPPPPPPVDVTTALSLNHNSHLPLPGSGGGSNSNSKQRVHECSICGAEFASGQALGGHMRRHRPLNAPPERAVITTMVDMDAPKKQAAQAGSINLELDLNLPAPSDDLPAVVLGLGQFNDGNKPGGLMLTASALVDCHY